MKISIVIPVYNVAPYIGDCIRSVIRQTWQGPLECIFVDDCGTDQSMEIVHRMIEDYHGDLRQTQQSIEFKIVRHTENRGLSAARNTGMDASTGDYVYFLDSDDEMTPDCIEALASPIAQTRPAEGAVPESVEEPGRPIDMTIGECRIEGGSLPGVALKLSDGTVLQGPEVLHAYRQEAWYMMSVNKLYRLNFLKENGLKFREGIIFEDELWSFQIACTARKMVVVGRETYVYKLREGSITVNSRQDIRESKEARKRECLMVVLGEMFQFATTRGMLTNPDVHNIIENFRISCLSKIQHYAPERLKAFYQEQRQVAPSQWGRCCQLNQFDLKKQVRDFHLALPVGLAIPYLRLLLWYYLKISVQ